MRDADEQLGPATEGLRSQIDSAILGDDMLHVTPGRDDSASRGQGGDNPGDGSASRGRGQRDDCLALGRPACTLHKVHLPTDAAVDSFPNGIGHYLARQVNLNR